MNVVHPVDRHVGQRLREARLAKGLSQTRLAEAVGLTFQQVQKYEKGTNRISASRLFQFASILGVEIPFFFENASDERSAAQATATAEIGRVDIGILRGLAEIRNAALKRALLELIHCVGDAPVYQEGSGADAPPP